MADAASLERFVRAQEDVYPTVRAELIAGRKRTHWMWFVFPQLVGLGSSPMAQRYAIQSLTEARAYLAHPVLGPRLLECVQILLDGPDEDPEAVLGGIDAVKFRSCLTLFLRAAAEPTSFATALERFFGGQADAATDRLLDR